MPTVKNLLQNIHSTKRTFGTYATIFGFRLSDYFIGAPGTFSENQSIHIELYNYFRQHKTFFNQFYSDWQSSRTMQQLADKVNCDVADVLALFNGGKIFTYRYQNGIVFKAETEFRYFSTYQVIELITGKEVIERPKQLETDSSSVTQSISKVHVKVPSIEYANPIIGYDDIKSFITDELAPIEYPEEMANWGLTNPGGILLYGPPGCGKTLWAKWIATYLKYEFMEIPRSIFGSSFVDGAMNNLKRILEGLKQRAKIVVFFDEFDSVATARSESSNDGNLENAKVVNTLLQEIPKLIGNKIILVAATNFVDNLDPAVIRPGRFDLKLPIFPPLPEERIELLFRALISDNSLKPLISSSALIEILDYNELNDIDKWRQYTNHLALFSNSHVIDTAKIIKRKIKQQYEAANTSSSFQIKKGTIETSLNEAKAKITSKDVKALRCFLTECENLQIDVFKERIKVLANELDSHDAGGRSAIGFKIQKK